MLAYPMSQTRRALIRGDLAARAAEADRLARVADEARAAARWARQHRDAGGFAHLVRRSPVAPLELGPFAHLLPPGAARPFRRDFR